MEFLDVRVNLIHEGSKKEGKTEIFIIKRNDSTRYVKDFSFIILILRTV